MKSQRYECRERDTFFNVKFLNLIPIKKGERKKFNYQYLLVKITNWRLKKMDVNKFDVDDSIRPQDDFDNYVNKKWKDENPVPDDQIAWGSFYVLREETQKKLKALLEAGTDDPQLQKVTDFYSSGFDLDKINEAGYTPLIPLFDLIEKMEDKADLLPTIGALQERGFSPLFNIEPDPDAKKPDIVIPYILTGGLGLPDRDYYFKEEREEIREKYQELIRQLLELIGYSAEEAEDHAQKIFALETELAETTPTNVDRHDPEKYFNKTQLGDLQSWTPDLNWGKFFEIAVKKPVPYVSTDKKEFYQKIDQLAGTLPLDRWKIFLKFRITLGCAPFLTQQFEEAHFNFYGRVLNGQKVMKDRWKRILGYINNYGTKMGELVGKLYIQTNFPPQSKAKMIELVANLQKALKKRLLNLDWMSEETKQKALLKHGVFRAKIGYPDKWTDFEPLKMDAEKPYVENVMASSQFDFKIKVAKMFEPTDPDEWEMHPQSINAYFHPLKNEIVFPAAILQFPMFDADAHDPINYGAIGVVIGHEMTHSYDNNGRKFNHKGELTNWWTDEDTAKFDAKTKYYVDEFSTYTVAGKNINGQLTLGENIADLGGLKISHDAMHHHLAEHPDEGQDLAAAEKEYFLSYARIWRNNMRPEAVDTQIQTDPHTPAHWRVNGALAHVTKFHEVFGIHKGDPMFREDIVNIW